MEIPVRPSKLDALAFPKLAPFFAEEIDRHKPRRIVSDGTILSSAHNDTVTVVVDPLNPGVAVLLKPQALAAPPKANDVTGNVALRATTLDTREIASDQNRVFLAAADFSMGHQEVADGRVERASLIVGRADYECPLSRLMRRTIFARDGLITLFEASDLEDAALTSELRDCLTHLAGSRKSDSGAQFGIALAADYVEAGSHHPGVDQAA